MCGITGFWERGTRTEAQETLARMTTCLAHRGPDDHGFWVDANSGVALGHRRLSIVDLSAEGHQPMTSPSGRYVIVFNGEIYNFRSMRDELGRAGVSFRGHSDTEVLLAGVERWGLTEAFKHAYGMFACAIWDRERRELHLVRDRIGEKPLYFGWCGDTLLFGSELKSLRAHPAWRGEIDRGSLPLFLRHNYVPAPHTIYRGIHKLRPGTIATIRTGAAAEDYTTTEYWSAADVTARGLERATNGAGRAPDESYIDALDGVLRQTISEQMLADVPVGAFLSGGVDSSLIVAVMQSLAATPVRTFTIGFHEPGLNEAEYAKAVAKHLRTEHTELYVTAQDALDVVPKLPAMYDEPFADSSQIPTYLVAKMTRRYVTVSLSGDGGDELFGGYNRYFWGQTLWPKLRRIPRPLRAAVASGISAVSPQRWNSVSQFMRPLLPAELRVSMLGDKLHKLGSMLAVRSPDEMYRALISHWREPEAVVLSASEPAPIDVMRGGWSRRPHVRGDFVDRMLYLDLLTYLPDDILVKVDRATMAVSLESRAPYLDPRVVEFAWALPQRMKVRSGTGKWILRQLLDRYVPRHLIERPKMGFAVPLDAWLRGPLREWADALLAPQRLRQEGFFDADVIRRTWDQHQSGIRNWHYLLWDVLMFQAWLEAQR